MTVRDARDHPIVALARVAPRPAPAPRSARVREIVDCAHQLLADEGSDAITMRRLAADLGIKAPSLYKHVASREAVDVLLVDDALFLAGETAHQAVDDSPTRPVAALLEAYRAFGLERPNLYRLATAPLHRRDELTPGLEAWAGEPFFRATGEPHSAQALWALAHGMVTLEIDQRFLPGSDLDRTWSAAAAAFGRR